MALAILFFLRYLDLITAAAVQQHAGVQVQQHDDPVTGDLDDP